MDPISHPAGEESLTAPSSALSHTPRACSEFDSVWRPALRVREQPRSGNPLRNTLKNPHREYRIPPTNVVSCGTGRSIPLAGSSHPPTAAPTRPSRPLPRQGSGAAASLPGRRRRNVEQRVAGRDVGRGQVHHVHFRLAVAAGALEPIEQHRLAGAARPRQSDVVRRSPAAEQVRQHLVSIASSRSRPVRAGGVAPSPGVNRRCSAVVMSTKRNVYQTSASAPTAPTDPICRHQFRIGAKYSASVGS